MADRKPILLRIPQDLWEQLNRWARDDLRSLNGQIEFLLREAVRSRIRRASSESDTASAAAPDGTEDEEKA